MYSNRKPEIEIRALDKKDYHKAISFAIKGMHFDWYLNSGILLQAYGRYFWYLEMNRATDILAAYIDGQFAGVLLAEIYGRPKQHQVWSEQLYVKFVDIVQKLFFKNGAGVYETTIKKQLRYYLKSYKPDGEIIFLAADPESPVKGIGTALLHALEATIPGRAVYLYTDNACTYQFYEHRGFKRVGEDHISVKMPKGRIPLECYIYHKDIPPHAGTP